MNFLLHRHLAVSEMGSPAAGAGAMLPDLWRMADRRVRAIPDVSLDRALAGMPLADVLAGVAHHLESDRWFHRTPVFLDGERDTAERFRAAGLRAPKLPLFAHIAWELCLDGALLEREGLATTRRALAGALDLLEGGADEKAAELHHFERVTRTPEERFAFTSRMSAIRERLARGPWIERYREGSGVVEVLDGIRVRLGLAPLDEADRRGLTRVVGELLARAARSLGDLLAARRALGL